MVIKFSGPGGGGGGAGAMLIISHSWQHNHMIDFVISATSILGSGNCSYTVDNGKYNLHQNINLAYLELGYLCFPYPSVLCKILVLGSCW